MQARENPGWRQAAAKLLDYELWLVGGLAAASVFYTPLLPAVLAAALLCWLARRLALGRWSVRTPFDWPVGLLLLTIPLTLWATTSLQITLPQVWRLLAGAALFYALANWASRPSRLLLAAYLFVLAGLGLALAAPFVVQWAQDKLAFGTPVNGAAIYSAFRLLTSDPANPNVMAGSLVLVFPLAAAFFIFPDLPANLAGDRPGLARLARLLAGGAAALMLVVLVLTQSRSAWLAGIVSLALLASLRWRWGWVVAAGMLLCGALLVGRVGLAGFGEALVSASTPGSLADRVQVWQRAIYMIQDFPFTGIGMGTYSRVADRLYPFLTFAPGSVEHAHNIFLQVAVDLGLPGLVAWLAVLLMGVYCASLAVHRQAAVRAATWTRGLGVGLLASQAALVTHGFTDAVTWGMVRPAPLVWGVWGLAAALILCMPSQGVSCLPGAEERQP
jgi:putative inorganic carbon (HCO3(-)) transporter